jgi:hypothetical protein
MKKILKLITLTRRVENIDVVDSNYAIIKKIRSVGSLIWGGVFVKN